MTNSDLHTIRNEVAAIRRAVTINPRIEKETRINIYRRLLIIERVVQVHLQLTIFGRL